VPENLGRNPIDGGGKVSLRNYPAAAPVVINNRYAANQILFH
jgi:hypothetical protein